MLRGRQADPLNLMWIIPTQESKVSKMNCFFFDDGFGCGNLLQLFVFTDTIWEVAYEID